MTTQVPHSHRLVYIYRHILPAVLLEMTALVPEASLFYSSSLVDSDAYDVSGSMAGALRKLFPNVREDAYHTHFTGGTEKASEPTMVTWLESDGNSTRTRSDEPSLSPELFSTF